MIMELKKFFMKISSLITQYIFDLDDIRFNSTIDPEIREYCDYQINKCYDMIGQIVKKCIEIDKENERNKKN